jgi:hypothetical protein
LPRYIGLEADEFLGKGLHAADIGCAPAVFDMEVAAIRPAEARHRAGERREPGHRLRIALGITQEHADPPHALLRAPRVAMPQRRPMR